MASDSVCDRWGAIHLDLVEIREEVTLGVICEIQREAGEYVVFQRDGVVALKGQSIARGTCSLGGYKPVYLGMWLIVEWCQFW